MKEYFNNIYRIFKTQTRVLSKNNRKKSQNIYLNINPEYQKDNYSNTHQNFFQYNNINNPQGPTYIPFNVINNNISSNDRIYQKYYYINQRNTPLNRYSSNNNKHANTIYNQNFMEEKNNYTIEDKRPSIHSFNENQNFEFYMKEKLKDNKKNNLNKYNNLNKTTGYKILNRTLSYYNKNPGLFSANKNDNMNMKENKFFYRQNSKFYLNIYRNRLIKIFVQNINEIIKNNKKKEIMKLFYNNLKKRYYKKRIQANNYFNNPYLQNAPKYHEYKDMIYNYIKSKNDLPMSKIYNILREKNKIGLNIMNIDERKSDLKNKQRDKSENNNSNIKENNNEIERFKKMQKKYGKIYETRKKSFEDKIKNYMSHKTIETSSSINPDNVLRKKIIFKHKRKKETNISNINLTEGKRKGSFNLLYERDKKSTSNLNENKAKNNMKRKKRLDSQSSSKSYKTLSEFRNIYNIYIIKNIVTADKRLYVNIKYINLDNFNNKGKGLYSNNILVISEQMDININANKYMKKNIIKHTKKLSKIDEEIDDKINNTNFSISMRDDKYQEKNEEKEKEEKNNNESNKENSKINKAYNSKKFNLSRLKKKYINYQKLKRKENEDN